MSDFALGFKAGIEAACNHWFNGVGGKRQLLPQTQAELRAIPCPPANTRAPSPEVVADPEKLFADWWEANHEWDWTDSGPYEKHAKNCFFAGVAAQRHHDAAIRGELILTPAPDAAIREAAQTILSDSDAISRMADAGLDTDHSWEDFVAARQVMQDALAAPIQKGGA